jgi:preprotein translocase subunit SecG
VLLQAGKGAGLGAAFGAGASQTVFGARSATFIGRITWVLAAAFMITSILLTMISPWGKTGVETGSTILHEEPIAAPPLGEATQQGQPAQQPIPPAESQAQPEPDRPHPMPETQTQP